MLVQCGADAGTSSTTLAQHQPNIEQTPRVSWDIHQFLFSDYVIDVIPAENNVKNPVF